MTHEPIKFHNLTSIDTIVGTNHVYMKNHTEPKAFPENKFPETNQKNVNSMHIDDHLIVMQNTPAKQLNVLNHVDSADLARSYRYATNTAQ